MKGEQEMSAEINPTRGEEKITHSKTEAPFGQEQNVGPAFGSGLPAAEFAERVRLFSFL
jgi:hypothetical protein